MNEDQEPTVINLTIADSFEGGANAATVSMCAALADAVDAGLVDPAVVAAVVDRADETMRRAFDAIEAYRAMQYGRSIGETIH